ncbi:hypothetical protein D3C80_1727010 [compost metagenome]
MGAPQQALLGQLVDVAADGLRGDGKGLGQFVYADVATLAGEVENVVLARCQGHGSDPCCARQYRLPAGKFYDLPSMAATLRAVAARR